jgi:two-component system sensor histidine kinase KdpD
MLKISVADDGPGIPVDKRERVFEKFFRGFGKDETAQPEGIGVGLSIAKGIVEAHGGRIWIEDTEGGRGTRVCFTVPVGDEEPPRQLPAEEGQMTST